MKMLIVEDEARISSSLKKGFSEEGFDVKACLDGEDGLNTALHEEFSVVILDLMLPKINGLTILRKMRERKIYTPVIILTAKGSVDEKVEGLDIGADDYLAKPFSFDELLARVRALIRRSTTHESILKADNLTLDLEKQIVTRNGKPIELSKREFNILEYLLINKGSILSEEKIKNHIWNYDSEASSNVVASHIKNLRNKIDKNFVAEKKLLKTIRGMGYKIDE